ncbi:BamA/TamA family outer membrane protein [Wenyingzhuangia aestuarii]|uniref:BamA/TamA family outer membrane protein n=1 Tax=Wenyingzhuangia aestuarii TaxID=1647582 RepID=UPI001439A429|nr:BamA/TamA family outer membrane protein [Wenyingzhuangia aestuarii]NJB82940.1 hypothetical protein [Wenyingzhuangia aestuarii]
MKFLKFFFLFFSFFLITSSNWAQEKTAVFILKDSLAVDFSLDDVKDISSLNKTLHNKGYYYYTSTLIKKDSIDIFSISLGTKTSVLKIKNSYKEIHTILKTKKDIYYIAPNQLNDWMKQLNSEFDKLGENFTVIELKNQQLQNDTLYCDLSISKSKKRFINKTVVKGYSRFSKRFLKYYIKCKKPFNKELLEETEEKINQLTFVQNQKKPAVLFTKDSTHLYLYIEKVKANKLDALIGFSNQDGESKIQFNGYIDLSLTNTLHKGETLAFKWNNSGQDQQEIDLNIDNPYIFNSPINVGYQLNIFRQDSTFVNTQQQFSLSYKPHYKHLISSYYHNESSTTLANTINNTEYTKSFIGLGYSYKEINSWRIPKIKIEFDIAYGTRKTAETTQQQTFKSDLIYNIEITPNNHFYIRNRNAYLRSANKTNNELYRIGGATTMRGFLEQSILSHLYDYANFEYRYFNNPISYLYAFSDVGHFRNLSSQNNLISIGLGYTLGTPSGLLKISYAVGKNQNTNFNISNGLFHINFVTIF